MQQKWFDLETFRKRKAEGLHPWDRIDRPVGALASDMNLHPAVFTYEFCGGHFTFLDKGRIWAVPHPDVEKITEDPDRSSYPAVVSESVARLRPSLRSMPWTYHPGRVSFDVDTTNADHAPLMDDITSWLRRNPHLAEEESERLYHWKTNLARPIAHYSIRLCPQDSPYEIRCNGLEEAVRLHEAKNRAISELHGIVKRHLQHHSAARPK